MTMQKPESPKPDLHVVSFSGGKDSTAMLLRMLEEKMPVDIILFCDTGLEFPQMYEHIDRVEKDIGQPITRVKPDETFKYLFCEKTVDRKPDSSLVTKFGNPKGYGWPESKIRWCTGHLKDTPRMRYLSELRKKYNVIEYVGIAADEQYRLDRKNNQRENCRHPLVDWGMTEKDCLQYCYDRGYDWGGLYSYFDRVSCWCCPLQPLRDLRQLYKHFPDLWEQLKTWDSMTWRTFKPGWSVENLQKRFDFEEEWLSAGNDSLRSKAFFDALKNRLAEMNE